MTFEKKILVYFKNIEIPAVLPFASEQAFNNFFDELTQAISSPPKTIWIANEVIINCAEVRMVGVISDENKNQIK